MFLVVIKSNNTSFHDVRHITIAHIQFANARQHAHNFIDNNPIVVNIKLPGPSQDEDRLIPFIHIHTRREHDVEYVVVF